MATVTPIDGGYKVTDANNIIAHVSVTCAYGPASFTLSVPTTSADGSKGRLNAQLGCDGCIASTPVDAPVPPGTPIPSGTYPNREVSMGVADGGGVRTLTLTVTSDDGTGYNEDWQENLYVVTPLGGKVTPVVVLGSPGAVVTGIVVLA